MDFCAVDVETANPDVSSICQIGVVQFRDGEIAGEWSTLVNPQAHFDPVNTAIHGIGDQDVESAPSFSLVADELFHRLDGDVAVCHTHFDRASILRACAKAGLREPTCIWLDTARVARRTWIDAPPSGGYGLRSVCAHLSIDFRHHDALEDARAAGLVFLEACNTTSTDVKGWIDRVELPIAGASKPRSEKITREGDADGPLNGEVIVFTGALTLPRREAADLAAGIGFQVASSVTKGTTLLVVGDQDVSRFAGHEKSTKHRKAEKLMAEGHPIRILRESDFQSLVAEFK